MKRSVGVIVVFSILAVIGLWRIPPSRTQIPDDNVSSTKPCEWIPGDLHTRSALTADSKDSFSSASAPLSIGELAELAQARGLRYLSVANRNRFPPIEDPAFGSGGLEWLLGYERTTPRGSLVLAGTGLSFSDFGNSASSLIQIAEDVHNRRGIVQIGRPEAGHRWTPPLLEKIKPDTVEVWRGGPFTYQTPELHKDSEQALRFYDAVLDHGLHIAVAGGSDTASRAISDIAGVGEPTSWACVDDDSLGGLIDAVREGRTSISNEPPTRRSRL